MTRSPEAPGPPPGSAPSVGAAAEPTLATFEASIKRLSEIVQTLFLAALTANEHELREAFLLDGVPLFRPHHDVFALARFTAGETEDRRA